MCALYARYHQWLSKNENFPFSIQKGRNRSIQSQQNRMKQRLLRQIKKQTMLQACVNIVKISFLLLVSCYSFFRPATIFLLTILNTTVWNIFFWFANMWVHEVQIIAELQAAAQNHNNCNHHRSGSQCFKLPKSCWNWQRNIDNSIHK